ncbi:spermatogenesis-associated protein 5 isoform X2 [Cimex lectularius]|uniref:AAA+ ATPase domain-containing protein n=1 Tax=Cimex lectularius TaxID=79782 RepID=A0A8I6RAE6_CIMLE|nr:spermatogenesis-associated protein 5 isoform X2 [Cimex lectularius]
MLIWKYYLPSDLRPDMLEALVFLSQSAMQLCGFVIGFPVVLQMGSDVVCKKAWPTSEGSLTRIRLSVKSLEFGWNHKLNSNLIKVSKLIKKPNLAKEVYFDFEDRNDISESDMEILKHLIQSKTRHNIYSPGFHVKVSFYGKCLPVKLISYKSVTDVDDVSAEMSKLTLSEEYFTPTNVTTFKLMEKQSEQKKIKRKLKFGGYRFIIDEIMKNIFFTFNSKNSLSRSRCCGILIYGIHGTGKTLLTNYLAQEAKVPTVEVKGMELFSKYYGETEARLRQTFESAVQQCPSILIIDNIENLCPKKGTDLERRVASTLLSQFDAIHDKNIVVLATSTRTDDIETSLRRPGRLEYEFEIPVPTPNDRLQILESLVDDERLKETINEISHSTHGFVAADLASVVTKAICRATLEKRDSIFPEDLFWGYSQVKPSAMREISIQIPNVKWSDIGGQEDLKLKLQQSVEWPIKYPDSFKRLGIKPPRGVLMFGPPGCSKTLVAKALATETALNFLSVKGSDIFSKWVGESERAMRDLFKRARTVAPAIIFLDEVDALGSERDSSSSGGSTVHERVLSQLLTEMDGIQPLDNVITIAATNRPDRIDKALLRPGRLDRLIYVPLPDDRTRREIFKLKFKKMPIDKSVELEKLVHATEGYSGAEVVAVCEEAAMQALEENIHACETTMAHFDKAVDIVKPRTPSSLIKLYENYINKT